jgi:uncharacterized protein with HEPN domain
MRDPNERLRDILDAINLIERYSVRGREAFEQDELVQNWMVRHLQIIGEAARTLPEEVRECISGVPWRKIIGMRHILVHSYFEIDTDVVWDVVDCELPNLKRLIEQALNENEHGT